MREAHNCEQEAVRETEVGAAASWSFCSLGSVDTPLLLLQDFCGSCPSGDPIPFFPRKACRLWCQTLGSRILALSFNSCVTWKGLL